MVNVGFLPGKEVWREGSMQEMDGPAPPPLNKTLHCYLVGFAVSDSKLLSLSLCVT